MVNESFFDGIDGMYREHREKLEAERKKTKETEVNETPLNARDVFFFYPLYLRNRPQAQKLLKVYISYKKNRANIVKEIFDMEQLLGSRILNTSIDVILSDELSQKIDKNYISAFEDLIRRLSQYRENTGKELFGNSEEMRSYVSYLSVNTKLTPNDYNKVLQFMKKT